MALFLSALMTVKFKTQENSATRSSDPTNLSPALFGKVDRISITERQLAHLSIMSMCFVMVAKFVVRSESSSNTPTQTMTPGGIGSAQTWLVLLPQTEDLTFTTTSLIRPQAQIMGARQWGGAMTEIQWRASLKKIVSSGLLRRTDAREERPFLVSLSPSSPAFQRSSGPESSPGTEQQT
jgi:hypothetical protein